MTDNELGTYASGGYGPKARNEFYASVRRALEKADAKDSIMVLHGGRKFEGKHAQ